MNEKIKRVRGIRDIVFPESEKWDYILQESRKLLRSYGYRSVYLPVIEFSSLFSRAIGEDTDIVLKEMYNFKDRKGRNLSLRPEGTASAARALIEMNAFSASGCEKIFYFGPMFRYERPQEGRYRQFHQFGCEVYGERIPALDAENVYLAVQVLEKCNVGELELKVNSVGCIECRSEYKKAVKKAIKGNLDELCDDCKRRFDTNTLRIMDCKNRHCQGIYKKLPGLSESLCGECKEYFDRYLNFLDEKNVKYKVNSRLVRGLDYYTGPVFEIDAAGNTLIAGGRYDGLIKQLGGPDVPACGWAYGLERVAELADLSEKSVPCFYLASTGKINDYSNVFLVESILRTMNMECVVEINISDTKIGKKLKTADRKGYDYAVLIGEEEIKENAVMVKNLKTGEQNKYMIATFKNEIMKIM